MHPAVAARSPQRRKTFALLAASAAVVGVAALLSARGGPAPRRAEPGTCEGEAIQAGALRFTVRPQSCAILRGRTETHVAIEIDAPKASDQVREPIALALVVDRSGSMKGEPMSDAKAAALRAVDALTEQDSFALVSYATTAHLDLPLAPATSEHKARARAAIEAMRAEGGTNISDGLERGATQLRGSCIGCPEDHVSRVVLISDGDPNEGIYDRDGLAQLAARTAQSGVSISTIGVGLDFDERIMTDMAVSGRGNYYFVESTVDLASIFDRELGSLGETVAVGARVELEPNAGVEIVEAYGYRTEADGTRVIVPVSDLRAGETRKVVVRVRVQSDAAGARELVTARLRFRPIGAHQERVADAKVAVTVTDDATAADRSRIADAERQVQEARMARALDEATEAYERGDTAKAEQILNVQTQEASAAAAKIGDKNLEGRMRKVDADAKANFATPASAGGKKKAAKANRSMGYGLSR
jgi:Ca-activated chloride channel homolog